MAICDVDTVEEDDYTLINVEESALRVGFCEHEVYCVTINRLVCYDPHFDNEEIPPEVLHRHKLAEYQLRNPEIGYFIAAHRSSESVVLGGSHE